MEIDLPPDIPQPPRIKLDRDQQLVFCLRQLFATHHGLLQEGKALRWAREIDHMWTKRPVPVHHLEDTLRMLVGQVVVSNAERWAWQLVGRHAELLTGPLVMFRQVTTPHWELLEIRSARRVVKDGKDRAGLQLFSLSGQAAGQLFDQLVPGGYLRHIAYQIACNRVLNYDDERPWLLTGMRFWGYVEPPEDVENPELRITHIVPSAQQKKQNADKLRLRLRYELDAGPDCPYDLSHSCDECPKGITQCQAAIRLLPMSAPLSASSASSTNGPAGSSDTAGSTVEVA